MSVTITLEEHYVSAAVRNASKTRDHYAAFPSAIIAKLHSLGSERLQDLDNGHVSMQVISHGPGIHPPDICKIANDELSSAIHQHPDRFAGFALLPMNEPEAAAKELERCIQHHKFVGALIDNHAHGHFYDDTRFWPVFEKAQTLDMPIYIHPAYPADDDGENGWGAHFKGNYDAGISMALGAWAWGWHSDTALSFLRLYAAGLFDTYPRLKIILGHMGEMLPFQLARTAQIAQHFGKRRSLKEVWAQNVWVTTSGMFDLAPLTCLLQTTAIERVLYSVDYPFSSTEKGNEFLQTVKKSGLISKGEDWERFCYKNALDLLKIDLTLIAS